MVSPDVVRACIDRKRIDLNQSGLTIETLELILIVLRAQGSVEVVNCGGVMSMVELGAYLRSIGA